MRILAVNRRVLCAAPSPRTQPARSFARSRFADEADEEEEPKPPRAPSQREPIDFFTLPKEVYSLQHEAPQPAQDVVDRAERAIRDLEQRAFSTLEPVDTEDGRRLFSHKRRGVKRGNIVKHKEMLRNGEIFEISSTLMDLDAWDNPRVRPYDTSDEDALQEKWSRKPRYEGVRKFVDDLEEQVTQTQTAFRAQLCQPYSAARMNAWDVVSVALRGADASPSVPAGPAETQSDTVESSSRMLDPRKASAHMPAIIRKNGIPEQAKRKDTLLIDWMLMRRRLLSENGKKRAGESIGFSGHGVNTVTSLRRAVTSYLDAKGPGGSTPASWEDARSNPLGQVVQKCSALAQKKLPASERLDLLSFLGNLSIRLAAHDPVSSLRVSWLGLRVATEHDTPTTLEYLEKTFRTADAGLVLEIGQDLAFVMRKMTESFRDPRTTRLDLRHPELRPELLRYLTGSSREDASEADTSLCALIQSNLLALQDPARDRDGDVSGADDALQAYRDYLQLLGHLGAVRRIWAEWRSPAKKATKLTRADGSSPSPQLGAPFYEAARAALPPSGSETTLPDEAEVRRALSGSLGTWLGMLEAHGWRDTDEPGVQEQQEERLASASDM